MIDLVCPQCESKKVEKTHLGCMLVVLGISMLGVFFWVSLILPPVGLVGMGVGVLLLVASPIIGIVNKGKWQCKECHFLFMPTK